MPTPMHSDEKLPELALSIRQPWAWAILCAGKDTENRAWTGHNPGLKYRGRVSIHAAQGMTRDEFEEAKEFIDGLGWTCPDPSALIRGAICGSVDVADVVSKSDSPWFFGPRGLVLANPRTCWAIPSKGELGYFRWKPSGAGLPVVPPWMANYGIPKRQLTATVAALQPMPLFEEEP